MKKLLPWLILAIIIRLVIIPITLHPDIRGYNFGAYLIAQKGHLLDFYDYLSGLPADNPLVKIYGIDLFIYPPIPYLTMALFMKILSVFYPWDLFQVLILDMSQVIGQINLPRLLYLLKGPFLVFELLGFWLIGKLFDRQKDVFLARILWLFNPVAIYASYMVSQFDIFIAVAILGTLVLFRQKRFGWAAVVLGLGAGVKQFPLFLIPFLALTASKKMTERIKIFTAGVGTYFLLLLPYLGSWGFRRYALLATQTDKIFFAKIPVSGAEYLPLFLVGLVFLFWWSFFKPEKFSLWEWFLAVNLLFFSLVHYHPQWLVWITPLLIIYLVKDWPRSIFPVGILLLCYGIIVLLFESSLNLGLFLPLRPSWTNFSISQFISRFYEANILASVIRGIFAATSLFMVTRFSDVSKS